MFHGGFFALSFSTIFTSFFEFLSNVAIVSHTITTPSMIVLVFDDFAVTLYLAVIFSVSWRP